MEEEEDLRSLIIFKFCLLFLCISYLVFDLFLSFCRQLIIYLMFPIYVMCCTNYFILFTYHFLLSCYLGCSGIAPLILEIKKIFKTLLIFVDNCFLFSLIKYFIINIYVFPKPITQYSPLRYNNIKDLNE